MNILCWFGIHKYTTREIHITEKHINIDVNACIMSRCDRCGEKRIVDEVKLTRWVIPEKYMEKK